MIGRKLAAEFENRCRVGEVDERRIARLRRHRSSEQNGEQRRHERETFYHRRLYSPDVQRPSWRVAWQLACRTGQIPSAAGWRLTYLRLVREQSKQDVVAPLAVDLQISQRHAFLAKSDLHE